MFIISPHFFRKLYLFLAFSFVQLSGTHRLYFTFEPLYPTMSCLKNTSTTFYPFSLCPYILLLLLPALLPIFHLNFPISFISFSIFSISFFCVTSHLLLLCHLVPCHSLHLILHVVLNLIPLCHLSPYRV